MEDEEKWEKYRETLPATVMNTADLITIEREWFEENLKKNEILAEAKKKLLNESDFQKIGQVDFIKKSGVKKLQNAFHISVDIVETRIERIEWNQKYDPSDRSAPRNGIEIYAIVRARARRPKFRLIKNGATLESLDEYVEAVASCSNKELAENKHQGYSIHNIIATAETRASNRAVMNLLKGDVSLEELNETADSDAK